MNLEQILYTLSSQGIKLWADGEQLKINAPKGSLTAEIRNLLSQNKTELLQLIKQKSSNIKTNDIPLVPTNRDTSLTLSYQQERLWSVAQLMPDSAALNLCQTLRIQGLIDIPVLQKSWNEIVGRHEILRTNFCLVGGSLVQRLIPGLNVIISWEDNLNLSTNEIAAVIEENIAQESLKTFDLSQAPLFNLKLLRFSETDGVLILVFHHIISDALSISLLIQEFLTYMM
ncbi:MAG: hypothetical protein F6J86_30200, partial [Symploca sp. SIO1B1]|nr:hypothetical protein [Symploca sp. SIO1B1]